MTPPAILDLPHTFDRNVLDEDYARVSQFLKSVEKVREREWTNGNGECECYWKEGINVGVSAVLRYYPPSRVTVVILSTLESGAWDPLKQVDRMLGFTHADLD